MSNEFGFKRARRIHARLRLGIVAVSGAGKTMGSLRLAKGIVEAMIDTGQVEGPIEGKIAVIDTERKSAALYAHVVPFDTLELEPPYSVERYQSAIDAAERAGYSVLIIDQITHAWAGPGGQLEWIDTLKAGARNAMSPWAKVTPVQQEFYDRMLRSPLHIIATMRAKSEYVIEDQLVDGRTKKVPRKIGLSPVQREGIEYEFTSVLDVDLESHLATATKDRTGLFMDRQTKLDEVTGRKVAEWLITGEKADASASEEAARAAAATAEAVAELAEKVEALELSFLECATLPDLAAMFDAGQKAVRGYAQAVGVEALKPFVERVIAAKEARKAAIQNPPPPAREPAGHDKVTPDDVAKLEQVATGAGLTLSEAYAALEVKRFGDLPRSHYAAAVDKLAAAGKTKMQRPAARKRGDRQGAVV